MLVTARHSHRSGGPQYSNQARDTLSMARRLAAANNASASGPRRGGLRRGQLCRYCVIAACILSVAMLLLWALTGRSPAAHLSILVGGAPSSNSAQLHLLPTSVTHKAACLDGSPPAVYVSHNPSSQDWLIYLGQDSLYWCLDDEDCLARSRTPQGSSVGLPQWLELHGLLSNSPEINPDFHNWSKAVFHACDGSGFLGYREAPFHVAVVGSDAQQQQPLYSRGYHVLWQSLHWLRRRYHASMQPRKARLLFLGQGFSGVALMVAAPTIVAQFPYNRVKFALEGSVLPGSLDSVVDKLAQVAVTHHVSSNPDLKTCLLEHPSDQPWRCLLLTGLAHHIGGDAATPQPAFFFSGSLYDRWLAVNSLSIPCPIRDCRNDEDSFGKYERLRTALIAAVAPVDRKSTKDAIWMCSCWSRGHLVHDQLLTRLTVEGWSLAKALRQWYFTDRPQRLHLVDGGHPSNPTCPL